MSGHSLVRTVIPVGNLTDDNIVTYYVAGGQNAEGSEFFNETWSLSYLIKGQYDRQADLLQARSTAFSGVVRAKKPVEEGEEDLGETEGTKFVIALLRNRLS